MFLKHLEPIFKPFKEARNKVVKAKTVKGNFKAETNRVKRFGQVAQKEAGKAGKVGKAAGKMKKPKLGAPKAPALPAGKGPGKPAGKAPAKPAGQGAPAAPHFGPPNAKGANMSAPPEPLPPDFNPNPPIALKGVFVRKKYCTQCEEQLDKTWDSCPYCAQAYEQQQQAPPKAAAKTQAFVLGNMANPFAPPMISWLVGIKGPQRGELFTLQGSQRYIVGTAETCAVVLEGIYLSGQHLEIFPKGDFWVLRDLGSSNGTLVNDKPVTEHELFDNDIITLGDCVYKFKPLEL